jgi:hypothetical protein
MHLPVRALLATTAALVALCSGEPAHAQCRGIWTKMCPTPPPTGVDEIYIPPPPDPAVEKLAADLRAFDDAMAQLRGLTRAADPFFDLSRPASEVELSSRLDGVLGAIWPEFSATAREAGLLRAQAQYWDGRNGELRQSIEWQRGRIAELGRTLPSLEQQLAAAGPRLADAQRREAELTAVALAGMNDRTSERRAIATMIAFSPEPWATIEVMDGTFRYSAIPGARNQPITPLSAASLVAPSAQPLEPTQLPLLNRERPGPQASVGEKLGTLQWAAAGWQQDFNDLGYLRSDVPNKRAENASLGQQAGALFGELSNLEARGQQLGTQLQAVNARIDMSLANAADANAIILSEIAADIVLEGAADKMRAIAEEIAGAEGIDIPAPPTDSSRLLDYVRRGGRTLLPFEGYRQQWDAFIAAQQQTIEGLGKSQGFMSEAAQVLATGSVGDAEALLERVFASVRWQAIEYAKTTGFSALPEEEGKPALIDLFERYAEKRRARETGA